MPSPRPRRRRLLLPTALAAVLAIEVTGLAIARSISATAAVATAAGSATTLSAAPPATLPDVADRARDSVVTLGITAVAPSGAKPRSPAPAGTPKPKPSAAASSKPAATGSRAASFRGRNHVWIPALRISAGIQSFPCSRTRPPDAGVYRWGCAGRNNVYLLSHAWSTFKPLHDAYVRGTLRKGMRVWYADGGGSVHEYRVIWWRVTAPTTAAKWAWAALPSPGMTLQTCVGANSEYRLMVRLDRVD